MSWSLSGDSENWVKGTDFAQFSESQKESIEQANFAQDIASDIISSGILGDSDTYNILLNGHANPDHTPRDGWSNDNIYISISQGEKK